MNQIGTYSGAIFGSNVIKNGPERGSKKCFKKGYPARLKQHLVCRPGGSWRRRLACAFSITKTTAWTATAATTATTAKTTAHVQFLFEVVAWIQLFVQVFVRLRIENWKNVWLVAPIRTQGWWSDTPWAKARRICVFEPLPQTVELKVLSKASAITKARG